jgi:hypothetical protein
VLPQAGENVAYSVEHGAACFRSNQMEKRVRFSLVQTRGRDTNELIAL